MRCTVYRSSKKEYTYLYLADTVNYEDLPENLSGLFGDPVPIMRLDLATKNHLANADIEKVKKRLLEDGYYLQLPPELPVEEDISRRFS